MGILVSVPESATIQPRLYVLRGLLWCRLCDESMVPTRTGDGTRAYLCLHWCCPCVVVPAEPVERLVWGRFVRLNEAAARRVEPDGRHAALVSVLRRVTVDGTDDLDYEWRD
jgi:hypothetical protein